MVLSAPFLALALALGAPDGPPSLSSPNPRDWPRVAVENAGPRTDDSRGAALFTYRAGRAPGAAERYQTVFAISLPFSFLWSYGALRGVEAFQGLSKEDGRALEKKTLVLTAVAGSALIALLDRVRKKPSPSPKGGV